MKRAGILLCLTGVLILHRGNSQNIITAFAGGGQVSGGDGGPATAASIGGILGLACDAQGQVYISEFYNHKIRKVDVNGVISTFAGNGQQGNTGDGGQATSAKLYGPTGVVSDASGNVYILDRFNKRVRKVNQSGVISTFAYLTGDALFMTIDAAKNLYISESGNNKVIRRDSAGVITDVAGVGPAAYSGDGGDATSAHLSFPNGVAVDGSGNIYIADYSNQRIRKVDALGKISTICGNGWPGITGDGGPAAASQVNFPRGLAVDGCGNLYIADEKNHRIRKINQSGNISTIAGTGVAASSGDNGPAIAATMTNPWNLAFDVAGNLYVSENGASSRVRKISLVGCPLGVSTINKKVEGVSVFPNPSTGLFNLKIEVPVKNAEFILFDVLGRPVYRHAAGQGVQEIIIDHLPAGLYNYVLLNDGLTVNTGRLVRQ